MSNENKWIVVHMDVYYPSVLHFNTELEAQQFVEHNKGEHERFYIAQISKEYIGEEFEMFDPRGQKHEDIEWGTFDHIEED